VIETEGLRVLGYVIVGLGSVLGVIVAGVKIVRAWGTMEQHAAGAASMTEKTAASLERTAAVLEGQERRLTTVEFKVDPLYEEWRDNRRQGGDRRHEPRDGHDRRSDT
jgi:hypothetical protein